MISETYIKRNHGVVAMLFDKVLKDTPAYIAGGFARYVSSPRENPVMFGDIDIFAMNKDAWCALEYTAGVTRGIYYQRSGEIANTWMIEPEAFGFKFPQGYPETLNIQIIRPSERWADKTHKELLERFDISVSTVAIISPETVAYVPPQSVDERTLQISFFDKTNPASTLARAFKYVQKGYTIHPDSILELVECLWNLPEEKRRFARAFLRSMGQVDDPFEYGLRDWDE